MPELPTSSLRRLPPAIQPIKTVFTYQSLWACHSVFESDAQRGGKEWPSYTPQSCELPLPDDLSFISLSEIGSKQSVFLQAIREVGTRWLGINGSSLKQRLRCFQERNRAFVAFRRWPENLAQISYVSHVGHFITNRPSSLQKKSSYERPALKQKNTEEDQTESINSFCRRMAPAADISVRWRYYSSSIRSGWHFHTRGITIKMELKAFFRRRRQQSRKTRTIPEALPPLLE